MSSLRTLKKHFTGTFRATPTHFLIRPIRTRCVRYCLSTGFLLKGTAVSFRYGICSLILRRGTTPHYSRKRIFFYRPSLCKNTCKGYSALFCNPWRVDN